MTRALAHRTRVGICVCAVLVWLGVVPSAGAQPQHAAELARAEELFRTGKEYLARGDHGLACPLLAESYRLDPATGSLLALALCLEQQGKLASAFRGYGEVVVRAHARAQSAREQAARAKLEELSPRLSKLTLVMADARDTEGLTVRVNDEVVSGEALRAPIYVDGGALRIEASQPGRATWRTELTVASERDVRRVFVPRLSAGTPMSQRVSTPAVVLANGDRPRRRRAPAQKAGLALLGAGSGGVAAGLVLAMRASIRDRQADAGCASGSCDVQALSDRADAEASRDGATIALITGAGVATAGLVTLLVGARTRSKVVLALEPSPAARGARLQVQGTF